MSHSEIADAHDQIRHILTGMNDTGDDPAQIRAVLDKLIGILLAVGLAYYVVLKSEVVGVHPSNRGGTGCSGVRMHRLLNHIVNMGLSLSEMSLLICFEDTDDKKGAAFTTRLQKSSSKFAQQVSHMSRLRQFACSIENN